MRLAVALAMLSAICSWPFHQILLQRGRRFARWLSHIPMRSTKADAKRTLHAYARRRSGDAGLSWKAARKRIKRWDREGNTDRVSRSRVHWLDRTMTAIERRLPARGVVTK